MPFTIDDFQELVRMLEQHPEWREALRRQVLSAELLALPDLMRQLVEAHLHTDQVLAGVAARLDTLAEAQLRAEQRLAGVEGRLAGVEARQERIELRMAELVEAQVQTQEALRALTVHVDQLVGGQRRLRQEVGSLSEIVGGITELEGERALMAHLTVQGYQLLAAPAPLGVDGEIDVAAPVRDAQGRRFWVLLEARVRLRRGDVRGWDRRLRDPALRARLAAEGVAPPFLPFAFGIRVYRDAEEQGRASGIGILGPHGERVAPTPWSS